MIIRDWPTDQRPREKLISEGANKLSDAELMAIILGSGTRGKSAVTLAQELINTFGDMRAVLASNYEQLREIKGLGPAKYAQLAAIKTIIQRSLKARLKTEQLLNNPKSATEFLSAAMRDYEHEVFACLFLNTRNSLIRYQELFSGSIDGASIYPREVVKLVLQLNASKVIFAHNHPSGDCNPSQADISVTEQLTKALSLVDVQVVDHIIVGEKMFSMAEQGMI